MAEFCPAEDGHMLNQTVHLQPGSPERLSQGRESPLPNPLVCLLNLSTQKLYACFYVNFMLLVSVSW